MAGKSPTISTPTSKLAPLVAPHVQAQLRVYDNNMQTKTPRKKLNFTETFCCSLEFTVEVFLFPTKLCTGQQVYIQPHVECCFVFFYPN